MLHVLSCRIVFVCFVMAFLAQIAPQALAQRPTPPAKVNPTTLPADVYLFCSFRASGQDGLHLAWSSDGLNWAALNGDKSYLAPKLSSEKLMRDPCMLVGPDGLFHLVWTTGWRQKTIGYASSKDLITWSDQKEIPVMVDEAGANNAWAPEIIYDAAKQQYLIFWATTIRDKFPEAPGHRMYCTTTKDFQTFTPTKLFYDPGFSVIDATITKIGDKFAMIVKDETQTPVAKKHLRVAFADAIDGPYSVPPLDSFTKPGLWVEGPSITRTGDEYIAYYDVYRDHYYGAMRTKDFKTWEDITAKLKFNVSDIRHGTALKVSREVLANLLNSATP